MKPNTLIVSEVFYSIQGEGPTMGHPAVFLRLSGCNLLCEGKGWRCDTIEVWQKGVSTEFEHVLNAECIQALNRGAHLVITGGEPMLHQAAIFEFLLWMHRRHIGPMGLPFIEVETNGTKKPSEFLLSQVDQWNVSPKLSNSGETYNRRVNEVALLALKAGAKNLVHKFVINKHEDILEIDQDYGMINPQTIMLMPAGDTRAKLNRTRPIVIEACKAMGYRYSERLHIVAWNKKTGV